MPGWNVAHVQEYADRHILRIFECTVSLDAAQTVSNKSDHEDSQQK